MAYKDPLVAKQKQQEYREKNRLTIRKKAQKARFEIKMIVLNHYGTKCAICGFSDYRALHLDHVDNDGASHRAELGHENFSGHRFYRWLKENDFPKNIQTLCANCNNIKQWDLTH